MSWRICASRVLAAGVIQLLCVSFAHAQATRTWVSGVGDDVNPCSRTAPCKTFAGAISKTAPGGEINVIDSGGYGAVTITKALTIAGDGAMASVLVSGTNGIIVAAGASDIVILRNLHLNGIGSGLNGIRYLSGAELHVEDSEIRGFSQQGIDAAPSASGALFVTNTAFRNNDGGAIYVHPTFPASMDATIDRTSMKGNGRGLRAEDGSTVVVRDSVATGNANNGFVALATSRPVDLTINDSISSLNGAVGVYSGSLATVRISNVTLSGNNVGLQAAGGAIISFGDNSLLGNNSTDGAPTSTVSRR